MYFSWNKKNPGRANVTKRLYTDDNTPQIDPDFVDMEYEYGFDEPEIKDNSKFVNNSIQNWKYIDVDIEYDDVLPYAGDNFINKSVTNWKYIN